MLLRRENMADKNVDSCTDPAVLQTLHRLADYPVLSAFAASRTQATQLDGRACRYLYEAAGATLAQHEVPENERAFMQQLGVSAPTNARQAECGASPHTSDLPCPPHL